MIILFINRQVYLFFKIIETIDQECFDFILKFFFNEIEFASDISKSLLSEGGLIQNSIGTEEDCLDNDRVYILFSGKQSRNELRNETTFKSKELLFREMKYIRQEVCIFKECRHIYKPFLEYLFNHQYDILKRVFGMNNLKIEGIKFNDISENEKVIKTKEDKEKEENEKKYFYIIIIILIILFAFIIILSIISEIMGCLGVKKNDITKIMEEIETDIGGFNPEDEELKEKNEDILRGNNLPIAPKRVKYTDLKSYKIISSFHIIKNLS